MRLDEVLLHPKTHTHITRAIDSLSHGYIVSGHKGLGKFTTILGLIAERHSEKAHLIFDQNWEDLYVITPLKGKKSIGIGQIKEAEKLIQLAHTRDSYVVVDGAELLTKEAQNAFLKTLEEPPAHIHIFLIAHDVNKILPTIRSRSQHIPFTPPPAVDVETKLREMTGEDDVKTILSVSQSIPGLAIEIAQSKEKKQHIDEQLTIAKQLFTAPLPQKLVIVNSFNKEQSLEVVDYLRIIAAAALRATASKDSKKVAQWAQSAEVVMQAQAALDKNANVRLAMTNLVLNL